MAEEPAHENDPKEKARQVLKTPTPRAEKVLKMLFGIDAASDHTLEEVGHRFAVARERIRQIEAKAPVELRQCVRAEQLGDFANDRTLGW